jgi:fumarylacetoacetate (FAA) hydrolase
MRLATLRDGSPDGALAVVSDDGSCVQRVGGRYTNLLTAIGEVTGAAAFLADAAALVKATSGEPVSGTPFAAPLPAHLAMAR